MAIAMHARIDGGDVRLLTRSGLDWSHRYQATDRRASRSQRAERIYRRRAGCSSPRRGDIVQPTASRDGRRSHRRTHLLRLRPSLPERRKHRWLTAHRTQGTSGTAVDDRRAARSASANTSSATARSFVSTRVGSASKAPCRKRIDRPYTPGDRGLWVQTKCLNREEGRRRRSDGPYWTDGPIDSRCGPRHDGWRDGPRASTPTTCASGRLGDMRHRLRRRRRSTIARRPGRLTASIPRPLRWSTSCSRACVRVVPELVASMQVQLPSSLRVGLRKICCDRCRIRASARTSPRAKCVRAVPHP